MNRDIFKKRENIEPLDYPQLEEYADSMNNSFWIVKEFNFTEDIQDFKVNITDIERSVIENSMLAISQIEVKVKNFWGDLYKRLPIDEIDTVGATFAESEVRHKRAYKHLLKKLSLYDKFQTITEVPQIKKRIKYLNKYLDGTRVRDNRIFTKSLILFSMFVEHVSLFSQFLIIMSFNKEKNLFKGISNVIEATSLEENVHGLFGVELINIIRFENPEWFDEDMDNMIKSACKKAFNAEVEMLDWIFEKGELEFLSKKTIIEFLKNRFNMVLVNSGFPILFEVDDDILEEVEWFDLQLNSSKEDDFFYKTSVSYNKKSIPITEDDIF